MDTAYLTVSEVAAELEISTAGVYKLIQRGKLPAIRRSERGLRVSRLALTAYQRRLQDGFQPPAVGEPEHRSGDGREEVEMAHSEPDVLNTGEQRPGDNGPLLAELRGMLLSVAEVRLAVLYGSLARGDADASSDLDLLVSLAGDDSSRSSQLAVGLRQISGRRVDLVHLERVETRAPLLLDRILDDGRVLVDRDGQWTELNRRRPAIRVRARRAHRREMAVAAHVIEELAG
ncbi:MAG TPA: helix-turn-helix domain-containing protein [Solirubrobacteraceae bacterium]|nr:helix-turn-helix domain-containing protein [Solirubrobacteraceae bacterium]